MTGQKAVRAARDEAGEATLQAIERVTRLLEEVIPRLPEEEPPQVGDEPDDAAPDEEEQAMARLGRGGVLP
jgi:hypothetical protein